jgi:hypothetical protein
MTDSLKHRAAAAENHLLLCPDGKSDAIKIIEDSSQNESLLKDCVAVHQLLETSFKDAEAASSKLTETLLGPCDGHYECSENIIDIAEGSDSLYSLK